LTNISSIKTINAINSDNTMLKSKHFSLRIISIQIYIRKDSNFRTLLFDQINNISVENFLNTYGGIDGIQELNDRTLVFENPTVDPEVGGWYRTTFFDPLAQGSANNGQPGSYDSLLYAQQTEVPVGERFSVWQISYVTNNGVTYLQLNSIASIGELEKFQI
jgi:hypothetical protein